MCKKRFFTKLLTCLLILALYVQPVLASETSSFSGDGFKVDFIILSNLQNGYNVEVKLTNTGSEDLSEWVLNMNKSIDIDTSSMSGGQLADWGSGLTTLMHLDWNYKIAPGSSASVFFVAGHNGTPPIPTNYWLTEMNRELVNPSDYTAAFRFNSEWDGNYSHGIDLVNTSSRSIEGWEVEFDITGGTTVDVAPPGIVVQSIPGSNSTSGSALVAYNPDNSIYWWPSSNLYLTIGGTKTASAVEVSNIQVYEKIYIRVGQGEPDYENEENEENNENNGGGGGNSSNQGDFPLSVDTSHMFLQSGEDYKLYTINALVTNTTPYFVQNAFLTLNLPDDIALHACQASIDAGAFSSEQKTTVTWTIKIPITYTENLIPFTINAVVNGSGEEFSGVVSLVAERWLYRAGTEYEQIMSELGGNILPVIEGVSIEESGETEGAFILTISGYNADPNGKAFFFWEAPEGMFRQITPDATQVEFQPFNGTSHRKVSVTAWIGDSLGYVGRFKVWVDGRD